MPFRWPLPALLAFLVAASASAQVPDTPQARIHGQVINASTGQPLPDAVVSAGEITVRTDASGAFELTLTPGSWTLEARTPDHLAQEQTLVVRPGDDRRVDFYLLDRRRFRDEVTVEAKGEDEGPAILPVRPADVLTVAGSADNVFRTLQTLPGVAATDEFGSRLSVRGGGPDQNLTVMDGVEIHNPYRLFGLTSAFNPETIRTFELSTGAFAARYGDRLSSLLLIENRDGDDTQRFSGTSSLSITDANVVVEGKLPKSAKGSWLVTGRRTYYDLVANRIVDTELPSFNDLQARTSWEPRPGHRLTAFALRSRESADASFESDTRPTEHGEFVTAARNDVAALRYDRTLGGRGSSRTSLSWYRNTDAVDFGAVFRDDARRSNAPIDGTGFQDAHIAFTRDLTVRDVALRQDFTFGASGRHLIEGGIEAHSLETAVAWRITGDRNLNEANGSSVRGGTGLPSVLDSSRDSVRAGAYVQDRFQVARRLVVEPGLRLDVSGINRQTTLSPRLRATLRLDHATRLIAGTGLFTQSPGYEKLIQSDYFLDLSTADARGLDSERSVHAVLGLERDLAPGLLARVEGYYKTFGRLIVGRLETDAERTARLAPYNFPPEFQSSVPTAAQITTDPVNGASGRAYGFDLYVARRAVSADTRLTGWASYTYGRATRDVYGHRFPFEYDRPHAVSAVASLRLGRKVEVSATGRFASGFPYTPYLGVRVAAVVDTRDRDRDRNTTEVVPERDVGGKPVYVPDKGDLDNLLSARLPAFARLDARVSFRPKGPGGRWLFYLDAINVVNRKNVGAYEPSLEYNPGGDRPRLLLKPTASVPFLPSFGVRFRF